MSILGVGGSYKEQALSGMSKAARLGIERENAEDQLEANKKATKASMAGSLAGVGGMIAASAGLGPVGIIGAGLAAGVAGYFAGDLF